MANFGTYENTENCINRTKTSSYVDCNAQWLNRRGGGGRGAECPPETSDREISADLSGKERQGNKGKWSRKEGKANKGRRKTEKRKSYKMRRGLFFFFSLFKTT